MTREEEYKLTLIHVRNWLDGDGGFDQYKPVNANFANKIAGICHEVVNGSTLEEAITKVNN